MDAPFHFDLQNKTKPKEKTIQYYWFENENVGLVKTLFHRIEIPLEPFDSGIDYVNQPQETGFIIEWINLGLDDPTQLAGIEITSKNTKKMEASIYIGSTHVWTIVESLKLKEISPSNYELDGFLTIEFEYEGIGKDEQFKFITSAIFNGELIPKS